MIIDRNGLWFTILLGVCAGLPALSIDLSAPTLAILPNALGTTVTIAGLSLSLFMVGFAAGQFVGGRASDRRGRRPVLLTALFIYTIAGICCGLATSGIELAAWRLVQGAGAGACAVQAAAIVQDLFKGEAARRKQSYVSIVLTIVPMLAPALGAVLIAHWNWRVVHDVLALGGAMLGLAVWLFMIESRPASARLITRGLGFKDGFTMLRGHGFRTIAVINALSYGTVFAYIAGAPVIVMNRLGYSAMIYAGLFASTALALSAGAMTNAFLSRRDISGVALIGPGLLLQTGSALALAACGAKLELIGPWPLVPALLASCFARGILSPNLVHLAISAHRDNAGLASAIIGLLQLTLGALSSALVALLLPNWGLLGVAALMAALSGAATLIWGRAAREGLAQAEPP